MAFLLTCERKEPSNSTNKAQKGNKVAQQDCNLELPVPKSKNRISSQDDISEGFHNLRSPSQLSRKSIRRVKAKEHSDIFDKKGITDTIVRMFSDDIQDLLDFFSDKSVAQNDEIISNPFCSLFPTAELAQCYAQSH